MTFYDSDSSVASSVRSEASIGPYCPTGLTRRPVGSYRSGVAHFSLHDGSPPAFLQRPSLLSSDASARSYRGFINLFLLALVLSNVRAVIENGRAYGLRFRLAYLDDMDPYHWPCSIGILLVSVIMPLVALLYERLAFTHHATAATISVELRSTGTSTNTGNHSNRRSSSSAATLVVTLIPPGVFYVTLCCINLYFPYYVVKFAAAAVGPALLFSLVATTMTLKLISYGMVNSTERARAVQLLRVLKKSADVATSMKQTDEKMSTGSDIGRGRTNGHANGPPPTVATEGPKLSTLFACPNVSYEQHVSKRHELEANGCRRAETEGHEGKHEGKVCVRPSPTAAVLRQQRHGVSSTSRDVRLVHSAVYPGNLTIGDVAYFTCAPTLVYSLRFARTEAVNWRFICRRLLELVPTVALLLAFWEQYLHPGLVETSAMIATKDFSGFVERWLVVCSPHLIVWLTGFYAFFHVWLNIIAELTRFADRGFYRDWWNSTTLVYFWRTWNLPVHYWVVECVYKPLLRRSVGKSAAVALSFFVSGFFHEYVVAISTQHVTGFAFVAMVVQIPLAIFTERFTRGLQLGNYIFWISIFLGQPLGTVTYFYLYNNRVA